jgi:hypothetical protein
MRAQLAALAVTVPVPAFDDPIRELGGCFGRRGDQSNHARKLLRRHGKSRQRHLSGSRLSRHHPLKAALIRPLIGRVARRPVLARKLRNGLSDMSRQRRFQSISLALRRTAHETQKDHSISQSDDKQLNGSPGEGCFSVEGTWSGVKLRMRYRTESLK